MVDTAARVLTFNGRRESYAPDKLIPSRRWSSRGPVMIQYLKKVNPHIIGAQEFTVKMCHDVISGMGHTTGLGEHWNYLGGVKAGNCPILYNTLRFDYMPDSLLELVMPSGPRKRYATLGRFRSRGTGELFWFGSCHLATNAEGARYRDAQMRRIGETINGLPDSAETMLCGDFNSPTSQSRVSLNQGTRAVAANYGLLPIRRKLIDTKISGESLNSNHEFGKQTEANWRWIDDVLIKGGITVERALLYRTCKSVPAYARVNPSDHNGILVEVTI